MEEKKDYMRVLLKGIVSVIYWMLMLQLIKYRKIIFVGLYQNEIFNWMDGLVVATVVSISLFLFLMIIELFDYPNGKFFVQRKLRKIGLKNKADEVPRLVSYKRVKNYRVYEFSTRGISLEDWEKQKDRIETIFNIVIISIEYKKGRETIEMKFVPARNGLMNSVNWNDVYLDENDFVLSLGMGLTGLEKVDLNKQNSILIGGSTGSGKTIELKMILYQCLRKGARLYLADFKGGIDFTNLMWHKSVKFITTKKDVVEKLDEIKKELEYRRNLFLQNRVSGIKEYNEMNHPLPHIIFACDEVAELLDTTGLNKEEKAEVQAIISKLSSLARLGRAFGIHLVLATQRPDANILPGQIKNNIDCRICGRADQTLSLIILDNTLASEKIEKNRQGRFFLQDGKFFQGFWKEM